MEKFNYTFVKQFLIIAFLFSSVPTWGQNSDPQFYILAPSGLNLRQTESPSSKKLLKIPHAAEISLLDAAKDQSMKVDNIAGGMAKVNYKGTVGYVFDGYISRYPPPKKDMKTYTYVDELLRNVGEIYYEEINRDWGGYLQYEEAFEIPNIRWEEGFLIAQQMFGIAKSFVFPEPSTKEKVTLNNPQKDKEVWEDALSVERNKNGEIISINYYYRREGGGFGVTIEAAKETQGLRISKIAIAD